MTNILIKNATVKEINLALLRLQGADSNSGTTTNVTVRSSSSSSGGSSVNLSGVYSKILTNAKNIASNTASISLINTKLTEDEKSIKANTTNITKNTNNIASNSSKIGSIIGILSTDLYTLSAGDTTLALKNNYTLTEQEVTVPYATAALNDSDGNAINDTYLKLTGGILTGDLTVNGNIYQNGSSYITHAEHLYSKDDLILTRDGATTGLSSGTYTGIEALLYDGTNNGYLVFDNTGTLLVGDKGSLVPLLARDAEANMTDGKLVYWDATNKILKTSSGTPTGTYLPLSGGTLTGLLTGTTATFTTVNAALNGNLTSLTSATYDSNNNIISSTYLPLHGGTMTGYLTLPRVYTQNCGYNVISGSYNYGLNALAYLHVGTLNYSNDGNISFDVFFGGDSVVDKCNVNIYGWSRGTIKPGIKITGNRFGPACGILGAYYVLGSSWNRTIEVYVGFRQPINASYSYEINSEFNRNNSITFDGTLSSSLPSGLVSVLPFGYDPGPWEATNVDATSHGIVPQTDNTYSLGVTNHRYNAVNAVQLRGCAANMGNSGTWCLGLTTGTAVDGGAGYILLLPLTNSTSSGTWPKCGFEGRIYINRGSQYAFNISGWMDICAVVAYNGWIVWARYNNSEASYITAIRQVLYNGTYYVAILTSQALWSLTVEGCFFNNDNCTLTSIALSDITSYIDLLTPQQYGTSGIAYLPLTGGTLTGLLTGTTLQFDSVTTILHPTSFTSGWTSLTAGTTYYVKLGSIVWDESQCQTKFQFRMYGNSVVSSVDVILSDSDSNGNLNITCNTNQFVLGYGIQWIGLTSSSSWEKAKDVYAVVIALATDRYNFTTNVETNNTMSFIAPSPSSTAVTLPYLTSTANRGISNNNYITLSTVNATTVNATTLSTTSARKYKKNIKEWKLNALDLIDKVDVVEYKYKSENDSNEKHIGFIADDTDKLLSGEKQDKMRILDSIGVLIKAVQELKQLYTNIIEADSAIDK